MHAADKVGQHRLGDFKIGDDAVFQRADGGDGAGGLAKHFLGGQAHRIAICRTRLVPF